MKKLVLAIALIFGANSSFAQITWSANIASLVYSNCSNCHNSNGIAPFELMSYQDAVDNGTDIKSSVVSKIMPPWPPDPAYSTLAHQRILSPQQISDIETWVDNGMPRGDSLNEPAAPVFNTVSEISNPDLILNAPVYTVNTTNDDYRCFVVPTNLLTNKYITAIEAIPGNSSIVHHILIYSDTTSVPAYLDALDPGPGYTNFGGTGSSDSKLIGVWVPGQRAYYTPGGMGLRLPANSNVILQIHYPGGISNKVDSTKLYLKLSSTPLREIEIDAKLNHDNLDQGILWIPANTIRTFTTDYLVPNDLSIMACGPHMHLIGTSISSWAITPSNDTIPFIDIPHWDFHWQGVYSFPYVLKIPAGTTLYSSATYDNTTNNPENPNNPPQLVHLGESTTDEMMLVYFAFTPYQSGDEYILIDSTLITTGTQQISSSVISTPQLYDVSPNPSSNNISFQYFLPKKSAVKISVVDLQGKVMMENRQETKSGLTTMRLNLADYPAGIYFLTMQADGVVRTKRFVKE